MNANEIEKKYRLTADYHTHTKYSKTGPLLHATGSVMQIVAEASRKGLKTVAITDHGPGHFIYGVGTDHVKHLRADIEEAKKAYPNIEVLLGVEANFKNTKNGLDVTEEQAKLYDFVNAGYHYGVTKSYMIQNYMMNHGLASKNGKAKLRWLNTDLAIRAIERNNIKVLTHPGDKGPFDMDAICKACEKSGTMLEINSKHKHLTVEEIKLASKYNVTFIIGSDAHKPEQVGSYVSTVQRAMEAGLDLSRIYNLEEI